jgi:hypothetical protein
MRFEQSYLKSIEKANGVAGVAYITIRDQVCRATFNMVESICGS